MDKKKLAEGEIDIHSIYKKILESKKLVLSSIIFFTLLGFSMSSLKAPEFKSSAIFEIGEYNLNRDLNINNGIKNDQFKLNIMIEPLKIVMKELKIDFIHKKQSSNYVLSISPIENRIFKIDVLSKSIKDNENLLNKIALYIRTRHRNIVNDNNSRISSDLKNQVKIVNDVINYQEKLTKNQISSLDFEIIFNKDLLLSHIKSEKKQTLIDIVDVKKQISMLSDEIESAINNRLVKSQMKLEDIQKQLPIIEEKIALLKDAKKKDLINLDNLPQGGDSLIDLKADTFSFSLEQAYGNPEIMVDSLLNAVSLTSALDKNIFFSSNQILELTSSKNSLLYELNLNKQIILDTTKDLANIESNLSLETQYVKNFNFFELFKKRNILNSKLSSLDDLLYTINEALSNNQKNIYLRSTNKLVNKIFDLNTEKNGLIDDSSIALFKERQMKSRLLYNLDLLEIRKKSDTDTMLISVISTSQISKKSIITIFGFIFGLLFSFLLIYIIYIFKNLNSTIESS